MHQALLLIAAAIARAHDVCLVTLGRRLSLTGRVARLEDRVARLEAENVLLRNRFIRVPGRRRPHYRRHERTWRSLTTEYVRHLFLHRSIRALEARLRRWARRFNTDRPHQGLGQRTPDDVYRGRRPRKMRDATAGLLSVRFLDGDHRLPILRLRRAA